MRYCDFTTCEKVAVNNKHEEFDACEDHRAEMDKCLRVAASATQAQQAVTKATAIEHWKGGGTAEQLAVAEATPLLVVTPE